MKTAILRDMYSNNLHKIDFASVNHLYNWLSGYGCMYELVTYFDLKITDNDLPF